MTDANLTTMAPIMKQVLTHANKFAAKQGSGKKKVDVKAKVKAKVSMRAK